MSNIQGGNWSETAGSSKSPEVKLFWRDVRMYHVLQS